MLIGPDVSPFKIRAKHFCCTSRIVIYHASASLHHFSVPADGANPSEKKALDCI